jgi:hypothetical protein
MENRKNPDSHSVGTGRRGYAVLRTPNGGQDEGLKK